MKIIQLTTKTGILVDVLSSYIVFFHEQITVDEKSTIVALGKDFAMTVKETPDEIRTLLA